MSYKYYRKDGRYGMIKEAGGLRTIVSTKDAVPTTIYSVDKKLDEALTIPRTKKKRDRHVTIGSGTRNPDTIDEKGYPPVEESLPVALQVAKMLYSVLGGCSTTGSSYDTPKTDTIASGGGTATLTLTTGGLSVDAHIGDQMEVTSGDNTGNVYNIIDNDASTLTLDKTTPANIDADGIKITTAPFLHTITEENTPEDMPTFAWQFELENNTDAQSIREVLLGVLHDALEILIEVDATAQQTVDIKGAKSVTASELDRPTDLDNAEIYHWCGVKVNNLSHNSVNLAETVNKIQININNNAELKQIEGDCYANDAMFGTRDYTIIINIHPTKNTLRALRNEDLPYTHTLAYTVEIYRVGGSFSTAKTDIIASGEGTTTVTLTTGGLTVDAHIGDFLKITDPGYTDKYYYITDNDAGTITTETPVPVNCDSANVEIIWGAYIKLVFDDIYVDVYDDEIPAADAKEYGLDVEFKNNGGGTLAVTSEDDLNCAHYEGSS